MMLFLLFILIVSVLFLTLYLFLNLTILFNKDYFLNKVQNKYILMYVKFVIFKTRIDIGILSAFVLATLTYTAYILHYLIVHPIIIQ